MSIVEKLKSNHPWIGELSYHKCSNELNKFRENIKLPNEWRTKSPLYPLKREQVDSFFVKETITHFKTREVDRLLERSWDSDTIASFNTPGTLSTMLFNSKTSEELSFTARLLIEFITLNCARQWDMMAANKTKKIDYTACKKSMHLFWCIVHFYKTVCHDFDDTTPAKNWDRDWYVERFTSINNWKELKDMRTKAATLIRESDHILSIRKELIESYDELMKGLLASVTGAARSNKLNIVRAMVQEMKNCKEMRKYIMGVPAPPFDTNIPIQMLEKIRREKQFMDFIDGDEVEIDVVVITSTTSSPTALIILQQCTEIRSEIASIRQLSAECAATLSNMIVAEAKQATAEIKRIHAEIVQATVELQNTQYYHLQKTVKLHAKRIMEFHDGIIEEMLPFSADQLRLQAVLKQKQQAKNHTKEIKALAKEVGKISRLIQYITEEESALLLQHNLQQRRRTFLTAAPHYLPLAMFETDFECGLCLQPLGWQTDADIGFVTCCVGLGYVCGDCLSRPHGMGHDIVIEREIVRVVRSVRRGLGV